MPRLIFLIIAILTLSNTACASDKTDTEIKKQIIAESIASYSGNCPCPYNTARNGSSCGKRSAYSRVGGASPICYEQDITEEMIKQYRKRYNQQ